MATIDDVRSAYEAATGRWVGCAWLTHYGNLGLDLEGVSSRQARRATGRWRTLAAERSAGEDVTAGEETSLVDTAMHLRLRRAVACPCGGPGPCFEVCGTPARRFCAEILAREWGCAATWLGEIESDALWAEGEARQAVRAAEGGDWDSALRHARQAAAIEAHYGPPQGWRGLGRAVEEAAGET